MTIQPISQDWLKTRKEQIQKEKEKNSKYLTLKDGENQIVIDMSVLPITQEGGKFGTRQIWTTKNQKVIDGKTITSLLLSASPTLDVLIVRALSEGFNPFTLIKVGQGKDTRYAIKELSKD